MNERLEAGDQALDGQGGSHNFFTSLKTSITARFVYTPRVEMMLAIPAIATGSNE